MPAPAGTDIAGGARAVFGMSAPLPVDSEGRIHHDKTRRDICATRVIKGETVSGVNVPAGRIHPAKGRRDVCATRQTPMNPSKKTPQDKLTPALGKRLGARNPRFLVWL